mgnify:CR=1 FL=1
MNLYTTARKHVFNRTKFNKEVRYQKFFSTIVCEVLQVCFHKNEEEAVKPLNPFRKIRYVFVGCPFLLGRNMHLL